MLAAMAMSVIACNKEQIESAPSIEPEGQLMTFTATAPNGNVDAPQAKSEIHVEGNTTYSWWSPKDQIRVFAGANSAVFTSNNELASATADFTGTIESAADGKYVAVYGDVKDGSKLDGDIITNVNIPTAVEAKAGTYSPNAALAYAVADGNNNFHFKNAVTLLKFQVEWENVSHVTFWAKGTDGQPAVVTGLGNLNVQNGDFTFQKSNTKTYCELYTINNNRFQKGQNYYMAVAPGEYSEFTIQVATDGNKGNKVDTFRHGQCTFQKGQIFDLGVQNSYKEFKVNVTGNDKYNYFYVYYKKDGKDQALSGWPGNKFDKKSFSFWIPKYQGIENVYIILNDGQGGEGHQTSDYMIKLVNGPINLTL